MDCKNLGFNVDEQLVEVNKLLEQMMIFLKAKDRKASNERILDFIKVKIPYIFKVNGN